MLSFGHWGVPRYTIGEIDSSDYILSFVGSNTFNPIPFEAELRHGIWLWKIRQEIASVDFKPTYLLAFGPYDLWYIDAKAARKFYVFLLKMEAETFQ